MGIYLPNMEMPQKGQMLVIFPDGTSYVCFNGMRERLSQTTAVPVPPHGRLIDADALDVIGYCGIPQGREDTFDSGVMWLAEQIDDLPTIIPAEEE